MKSRKVLLWTLKLLYTSSPKLFISILLIDLIAAVSPSVSYLIMKSLVDFRGNDEAALVILALLYVFTALFLPQTIQIAGSFAKEKQQRILQHSITAELIGIASNVPLEVIENPKYQDLLSSITGIENQTITGYWQRFQTLIMFIIQVFNIMVVLLSFHAWLPLMMITVIIPVFITHRNVRGTVSQFFNEQAKIKRRMSYYYDLLTEPNTIKEVRAYELENWIGGKWNKSNDEYIRRDIRFFNRLISMYTLRESVSQLIFGTMIITAFYWAATGIVTAGSAVVFSLAVFNMSNTLKHIFDNFMETTKQMPALDTLINLYEHYGAYKHLNKQATDLKGIDCVEFQNVSFQYPGNENVVLKDLSFSINKGEKIALVGENGSGKSTLIRLLLNLNQPTEGEMLINGVPSGQWSPDEFRERITVSFQDFCRYHLLVRDNIGLSQLSSIHNDAALKQAANEAGASDFIQQLPNQFDQQLGVKYVAGVDLSGGQWQKLAVARSYFRDADVLIMDEPTAALDPVAEVEVYRRFSESANGKIAIIVSHRLGSATLADKIIFLKEGRIVEVGSHGELMKLNGNYACMYNAQAEWYR